MTEINEFSLDKIDNSTEKLSDLTEKISSDTEEISQIPEKMTEKVIEKRGIGQRGKDKNQRKINPNSLRNLKPLQNLSKKDNLIVSQKGIILERDKPVWKKAEFWVTIGGLAGLFVLAWKLKEVMDKARAEKSEEETLE